MISFGPRSDGGSGDEARQALRSGAILARNSFGETISTTIGSSPNLVRSLGAIVNNLRIFIEIVDSISKVCASNGLVFRILTFPIGSSLCQYCVASDVLALQGGARTTRQGPERRGPRIQHGSSIFIRPSHSRVSRKTGAPRRHNHGYFTSNIRMCDLPARIHWTWFLQYVMHH